MTLRDEITVLQDLPPFASLAPAKLKLLAVASEHRHFEAGDILIQQGAPANALFVILGVASRSRSPRARNRASSASWSLPLSSARSPYWNKCSAPRR